MSPAMLSKARERFGLNPNIAYLSLDFVTTLIPGKFDVVISALALHHTPQPELKGVFQKVFDIQSTPMANRSRFRARGLLVQKLLLCRLLWPKIMLLIASNQAFTRCLLRDTIRRCTR
jgi:hypothetical protein